MVADIILVKALDDVILAKQALSLRSNPAKKETAVAGNLVGTFKGFAKPYKKSSETMKNSRENIISFYGKSWNSYEGNIILHRKSRHSRENTTKFRRKP